MGCCESKGIPPVNENSTARSQGGRRGSRPSQQQHAKLSTMSKTAGGGVTNDTYSARGTRTSNGEGADAGGRESPTSSAAHAGVGGGGMHQNSRLNCDVMSITSNANREEEQQQQQQVAAAYSFASSSTSYSDPEDEMKRKRVKAMLAAIESPALRKRIDDGSTTAAKTTNSTIGANNNKKSNDKDVSVVEFYNLGESTVLDDWFIAYCKATTARSDAFKANVINVAPPKVRKLVIERTRERLACSSTENGNGVENIVASGDETSPSTVRVEEGLSNSPAQHASNTSTSTSKYNSKKNGDDASKDNEVGKGVEPSEEEQLYAWKLYGFATLPKEDLMTLDATFFSLTKQSTTMTANALTNLRRKIPKLLNEREELFIFFLSVLSLRGRESEFRDLSPVRIRKNFTISEWTLDVSTWRVGWFSLECYNWHEAKTMILRLNTLFDDLPLDSDYLFNAVRFAYLFYKKDASTGTLVKADAIKLWKGFYNQKWPLLNEWIEFLDEAGVAAPSSQGQKRGRTHINQDEWDQLASFVVAYPNKSDIIAKFDPTNSFWPSLMDSFANHIVEKQRQKSEQQEKSRNVQLIGNVVGSGADGLHDDDDHDHDGEEELHDDNEDSESDLYSMTRHRGATTSEILSPAYVSLGGGGGVGVGEEVIENINSGISPIIIDNS